MSYDLEAIAVIEHIDNWVKIWRTHRSLNLLAVRAIVGYVNHSCGKSRSVHQFAGEQTQHTARRVCNVHVWRIRINQRIYILINKFLALSVGSNQTNDSSATLSPIIRHKHTKSVTHRRAHTPRRVKHRSQSKTIKTLIALRKRHLKLLKKLSVPFESSQKRAVYASVTAQRIQSGRTGN